jgi:hypothetical protein
MCWKVYEEVRRLHEVVRKVIKRVDVVVKKWTEVVWRVHVEVRGRLWWSAG